MGLGILLATAVFLMSLRKSCLAVLCQLYADPEEESLLSIPLEGMLLIVGSTE